MHSSFEDLLMNDFILRLRHNSLFRFLFMRNMIKIKNENPKIYEDNGGGNYCQHAETSKSRIIMVVVVIFDPSVGNYGIGERGKILKSHDGGS